MTTEGVGSGDVLDPETLSLGQWRGTGALGSVYDVLHKPGVVIKTFENVHQLRRERMFWHHIRRKIPEPVTYLGSTREGILMVDAGRSLLDAPSMGRGENALRIVSAIRAQLCALHRLAGIEHRDLNPSNVMVDRLGVVRIVDMSNVCVPGYERLLRPEVKLRRLRGTIMCRSPEEMLGIDTVPFSHDAWAMGTLILWLCTNMALTSIAKSSSGSTRSSSSGSTRSSSSSSCSPSSPDHLTVECDEDHEFGQMLREAAAFVRLHGCPENVFIRREWFVALAGTANILAGPCKRAYDKIDPRNLQCPQSVWEELKPLVIGLLSEHPQERVRILHDDSLWKLGRGGSGGSGGSGSHDVLHSDHSSSSRIAVLMKYAALPSGKLLSDAITMLDARRVDSQLLATMNHLCVCLEENCVAQRCTVLMPDDADIHPMRWVCALAVIDVAVHICGSFGAATQNVVVSPGTYVRGDQSAISLFAIIEAMWEDGVASAVLARMVDASNKVKALDWLLR